jgi:RES domain-containing protein
MLGVRLCRARYAALDGAGASRAGGRWNPPGMPMVYLSDGDALAVLEVRVHLPRYIPSHYVFVTVELPWGCVLRREDIHPVPPDWRSDLAWSRRIGARFLGRGDAVALTVPSSVVPSGRNVLLNPRHPDMNKTEVHSPRPFAWDQRLWTTVQETLGGEPL